MHGSGAIVKINVQLIERQLLLQKPAQIALEQKAANLLLDHVRPRRIPGHDDAERYGRWCCCCWSVADPPPIRLSDDGNTIDDWVDQQGASRRWGRGEKPQQKTARHSANYGPPKTCGRAKQFVTPGDTLYTLEHVSCVGRASSAVIGCPRVCPGFLPVSAPCQCPAISAGAAYSFRARFKMPAPHLRYALVTETRKTGVHHHANTELTLTQKLMLFQQRDTTIQHYGISTEYEHFSR